MSHESTLSTIYYVNLKSLGQDAGRIGMVPRQWWESLHQLQPGGGVDLLAGQLEVVGLGARLSHWHRLSGHPSDDCYDDEPREDCAQSWNPNQCF